MSTPETFPDDENGDVLRRMQSNGDDLTIARNIDYTVVFASEALAEKFAAIYAAQGFETKVNNSGVVHELPWDVVVVNHMTPSHSGITAFEVRLAQDAAVLGGRNDGWGSFQQ